MSGRETGRTDTYDDVCCCWHRRYVHDDGYGACLECPCSGFSDRAPVPADADEQGGE